MQNVNSKAHKKIFTAILKKTIIKRMGIGKRVQAERIACGYHNATAFADMVKVKQSSLWNLENGKTKVPEADTLLKIADGLRVNPRWLMWGHGPKQPADGLTPEAYELAADWLRILPEAQQQARTFISKQLESIEALQIHFVIPGSQEEAARKRKVAADERVSKVVEGQESTTKPKKA